ncbi:MAG: hypothetical protein ABI797_05930 [Chloroflexota bacterium]
MRRTRRLAMSGALLAVASLLSSGTAMAAGTTIYNTIPSPTPGNVPSLGYEATSTSEFGDQVAFAAGPRQLREITVLMSSWGCESGGWNTNDCVTTPGATFSHAITVNVYAVGTGNSVGALAATKTQTFAIPYRPSADPDCTGGRWEESPAVCYNGFATPITFDLASLNVTLPNNAIVSVAYNTSHYGYAPIGDSTACYTSSGGCGYDSLNVGVVDPALTQTSGTNPAPTDAYFNTSYAPYYCDLGAGGVGVFRLDAGCWAGFKPALKVTASYAAPQNANACKKDGWKTLSRADSSDFKNQGDCIQYANTGK